jgi:DNA-nicking Smr family endonuclease
MSKKIKNDPDDLAAFHRAVADVKPLARKKTRIEKKPPQRIFRKQNIEEDFITNEQIDNNETVTAEAHISYHQDSIPYKTLRKLRKGQYTIEATLDLHGMTVENAHLAVNRFLQDCYRQGARVILIIHGKNRYSEKPILKNKLNYWLRGVEVVLAFCSAAPGDGSRGAIYVLLKSMQKEKYL